MLTLRWCSFLEGTSDIIGRIFAHNSSQNCDYRWMLLHSPVIVEDARPQFIHAPLTLISELGQGAYCLPFELKRGRILPLSMDVTMQPFDCWMGQTLNCGHFVNPHLSDILSVIGCSTIVHNIHTVIIDSQRKISMYNHLHPQALRHLSFWATTMHVIKTTNCVHPMHFSAFGRQFTVWKWIHLFQVYIA